MGGKGYSPGDTAHVGQRTAQHPAILGEGDTKHGSGQRSSCLRWFLGVLRTCSSANVLAGTLPLFDLPVGSQPGLLLCVFTCFERLDQGEWHECHPWIQAGDVHAVLCIVLMTGGIIPESVVSNN